jgi:MoaA/NifB/PqqE/SkfB family radical SAM enzyme
MVIAELVDKCNLKCVLCPSRFREQSGRQMSLETVQKILKLYPNRWIHWYNWGEGLLHKDFLKVADIVDGTPSRISTNLSLKLEPEYFKALRKFKIVTVSISGMTKEVYDINHQGGDFDLVMGNLEKLLSVRVSSKDTVINWLSHKHNKHQEKECEAFCKKAGITFNSCFMVCTIEELDSGFEHELLVNPKFQSTGRTMCIIVKWIPIDVDGNYVLCCASQNVKIGYTIDDNISIGELVNARLNTSLCGSCREKELWRMFS